MSHYSVMVKLSEALLAKHHKNIKPALAEILAPYEEYPDRPSPFMTFVEDAEYDIDKGTGKHGHWHNPNAKWDWYVIGGRWTGLIPVKPGRGSMGDTMSAAHDITDDASERFSLIEMDPMGGADIVRLADIDFDAVAAKEREAFDEFKAEYRALLAGKKFPPFEGPRHRMLDLGLMRCAEKSEVVFAPSEVQIGRTWGEDHGLTDSRKNRIDIARNLTDEQLDAYRVVFSPLKTYAALDESGWHSPGKMGWFGMSDDTPESLLEFARGFVEKFVLSAGPFDLLVVVDCHI